MNPDTNRFEQLMEAPPGHAKVNDEIAGKIEAMLSSGLVRPNGEPVPMHWTQFQVGEHVVIKDYTFKVAYVGETSILFEPVGPVVVGDNP